MSQTQTWTVGRLLEWTTDYLKQHGSDSPRLDAEVLLSHARNCPRIQLYTTFADEPDETCRAAFREMVKRRSEGTPVAYLVGHKEFYSLDFIVTPDVLIPRSETEHLVIEALDGAKRLLAQGRVQANSIRIADLCTGSGCVAAAIAKHLPGSRLLATDLSETALEIAKRNIAKHHLEDRIQTQHADLWTPVTGPAANELFDIVVSNPPYVSESEYAQVSKSVRDFEPRMALVAGNDGLAMIERLISESTSRVREGGYLMIELSPMIAKRVEEHVAAQASWKLVKMAKDLAGHARIAVLKRESNEQ